MATKTRRQSYRGSGRGGGRFARGRQNRGAKPGGPRGLVSQITGQLGRGGGRAGRRDGGAKGGGLATKATSFVSGFLGGGGKSGRRRR